MESLHAEPAWDTEEAAWAWVFQASRGGAAPASQAAPICGRSRMWKRPLTFRTDPDFNRRRVIESLVDVVTIQFRYSLTQK